MLRILKNARFVTITDNSNHNGFMGNGTVSKRTLRIGTALIWAAVLLGISFFTEAEQGRNLDWELMWIIVGGFIVQTALIGFYTNKDKNE